MDGCDQSCAWNLCASYGNFHSLLAGAGSFFQAISALVVCRTAALKRHLSPNCQKLWLYQLIGNRNRVDVIQLSTLERGACPGLCGWDRGAEGEGRRTCDIGGSRAQGAVTLLLRASCLQVWSLPPSC